MPGSPKAPGLWPGESFASCSLIALHSFCYSAAWTMGNLVGHYKKVSLSPLTLFRVAQDMVGQLKVGNVLTLLLSSLPISYRNLAVQLHRL